MKKALILGLACVLLATGGLCNKERSWFFVRPTAEQSQPSWEGGFELADYNTYFLGDASRKEIFLTFDEGYENGFTAPILDILREKNVPAAFFVTKPYMREHPDLIRRMIDEGHIVGNHTVRHKSSPTLSDTELVAELVGVADYFKENFGEEIPRFFRPPMGEYSERVLRVLKDEGYATIFWSFAYADWQRDKQPSAAEAHKKVVEGLHNGAVLLLHAVSSANAQALGDIIDSARAAGYEFKCLYHLTASQWPPIFEN